MTLILHREEALAAGIHDAASRGTYSSDVLAVRATEGAKMIPEVTKEKVLGVLQDFDASLRSSAQMEGWEKQGGAKYALLHDGRRYPPKDIVALATGSSKDDFGGGWGT